MKKNAQLLQASYFFHEASQSLCLTLAKIGKPLRLKKKAILFLEQTEGNAIYLLIEGSIQIHKTNLDGTEIVIRTIKAGEIFAEVILFEENLYPVTAIALTNAKVLSLAKKDILKLLNNEGFRNDFIAMLMHKQRYLAERVRFLTSYDVEERFRIFLSQQYSERNLIAPKISKKDMAAAIGTSPETFSRMIRKLKKEKLLEWKGKTIRLTLEFWKNNPEV